MMTRIILVRHGETDWNATQRWQGWQDTPLNAAGIAQAQAAAAGIKAAGYEIGQVMASPLQRAYETGRVIAEALDLPLMRDGRLQEINVGDYSGMTSAEVHARYGRNEHHHPDFCFPNGESNAAFRARIVTRLEEIAQEYSGQQILIATHGGPIRYALRYMVNIHSNLDIFNCSVTQLVHDGSCWRAAGVALHAANLRGRK